MILRRIGGIVFAILCLYASAQISFPLPGASVPQTAQTLAVVLVAAFLGPVYGTIAIGLYIALGMLGLPVFSSAKGGIEVLSGPAGGYLVGFLPAAVLVGWWTRRGGNASFLRSLGGMLAAHAVILSAGGSWLAFLVGPGAVWSRGIAPFLYGAVVKSIVAAGAAVWIGRRRYDGVSTSYNSSGGGEP